MRSTAQILYKESDDGFFVLFSFGDVGSKVIAEKEHTCVMQPEEISKRCTHGEKVLFSFSTDRRHLLN